MMKSHNNKALFSKHYLDELAYLRSQIMTSKAGAGRHIFLIPSRSRAWIWQEGKQKPNVDLTRLLGRLQAIQKGGESLIPLKEEHFEKLISITGDLGEKLRLNKYINNTLKKFAILSYSTTGNGHYLQQKGLLKIEDL